MPKAMPAAGRRPKWLWPPPGGAEERRSGSAARLRLPSPCLFVWTDPSRSWGRWPQAAGAPRQQLPPIAASPCAGAINRDAGAGGGRAIHVVIESSEGLFSFSS